ncbi:MAG: 2-hydroxy-6-oxo-2,4-heptadienoate hydrolase [Herminiimonas sp.]|nr:2-hydroxy-6-oxo-2,4-heptadienoate hydrolase [Herminiimonas sp.]
MPFPGSARKEHGALDIIRFSAVFAVERNLLICSDKNMSNNPEIGKSIIVNGIQTNYQDHGEGPPVLLIHGSGPGTSASTSWRQTIPALSPRFRLIAPDMLGFGFTERPSNVQYKLDTWVDHTLGLLSALDIPKAHVVGTSYGGAVALALAARAPQRVDRLVLISAVGISFPITETLDSIWGYTPSVASMRAMLDLLVYDRSLLTDEMARLRYEASIRPGFQEAFSSMFTAPRQKALDGLATPEHLIKALPHKALLIHGREDQINPLSTSQRLFNLIDDAQLHVFGRCCHMPQAEHAARFNRLVGDFLAEGTP